MRTLCGVAANSMSAFPFQRAIKQVNRVAAAPRIFQNVRDVQAQNIRER